MTVRAVVMLACLATFAAHAHAQAGRFGLVIGSNTPKDAEQHPLRYADDDAIATQQLLIDAGVDSTLLVTPDAETRAQYPALVATAATLTALEHALVSLTDKVRAANTRGPTELLLFYSGHGGQDEAREGYVLLDGQPLTRSMLAALLVRVGATRNHVIIDACKSNLLIASRGPGGRHAAYSGGPMTLESPAELNNTGWVLSTSSGRDSHEWERYQGGILSHELRSALRGAADLNHDAAITYAEVGAFLEQANAAITARFRPDFMVHAPAGDLDQPLLTWHSASALQLDPADWGHVYVETARGERLLDVHPASDAVVQLWTPPERPIFVRREDDSAEYVVELNAPHTSIDPHAQRKPPVARKGALSLAFEQLFAAPFAASDLQRYQRERELARVQRTQAFVQPGAEPASVRPWLWAASAATALFGATSLTLAVLTQHAFDASAHAADSCSVCSAQQLHDTQRTGRTLQTLTNVSLAATGVTTALAAGLFMVDATRKESTLTLGPGSIRVDARF